MMALLTYLVGRTAEWYLWIKNASEYKDLDTIALLDKNLKKKWFIQVTFLYSYVNQG